MNLRCRIGFHAWQNVAWTSILNPIPLERCKRCGIGRQFHIAGFETRYCAEQMANTLRILSIGDPKEEKQ